MNNLPHTFFVDFDIDFKAEVIAAEMVEHGLNADRILILLAGGMKRSFRNDVTSVEEEYSEYDHKDYTVLKTSREGIYDMLPEGLFHHPEAHRNARTNKEIIDSIKQRKSEEITARKFFLPFETTMNYLRMQMALYENKIDKRSHYNELINVFSEQWEIFQYLDARQANIFLHLIPILHDLRDDFEKAEIIFEAMFVLPVTISLQKQILLEPQKPIISLIGEGLLGIDLTTGNESFNEGEFEINVQIHCNENNILQQFMHGNKNEKILQLLCDYLLPVHLDVVTTFELAETYKLTRLADTESFFNSVLGTDTYL